MAERFDASPDSLAVMLRIPDEIAADCPEVPDNGPPHVTMVHAKPVTDAHLAAALDMVRATVPAMCDEPMSLGGLEYFDSPEQRVAFASVKVSDSCMAKRDGLAQALSMLGLPVSRMDQAWVPHATLAYLEPGQEYAGAVPSGSWPVDAVEVWRGGDRFIVHADGRMDRLAERDGQWVAMSEDGATEFGTYAIEAEARERLRQVEAAKAAETDGWEAITPENAGAIADELNAQISSELRRRQIAAARAGRSEDEKAGIRKRWQADGPNMGAARMREWLDSPFSGPNRKAGPERERARRVADRALGLMEKPTAEWTGDDYSGALQVLAFIERMSKVEQGEPLTVDGREGPSARDASLRDWGFDPKADRGQQVLFDVAADGSITLPGARVSMDAAGALTFTVPAGLATRFGTSRAPAIHTESRVHVIDAIRADRVEFPTEHKPVYHMDGWVLFPIFYSRGGNIQVYDGVREYRPKSEVFKRESMDSGIGNPWELRHSADLLSPATVRGVARGCIVSVDEYVDGEHTFGWAKAWDRDLLAAIEGVDGQPAFAPEVSVAFRCRIDRRPGTDDYGNPFDQRAFDIVWNSLASEPHGRAGTARVLGVRADAANAITVHGADELLALAGAQRLPGRPVFYDRSSWTRFDSARSQPLPTQRQDSTMLKKVIPHAMALGLSEEAIANAIGQKVDEMAKFMEGPDDLKPDQANALMMLIGNLPEPDAPVPSDQGPPSGDAPAAAPMADGDMAKIMIGGAGEFDVPKAVAEYVAMLEGRADRAGKRADKAETELAKTERELQVAKSETVKHADAMSKMVSHADARAMVDREAQHIADAMTLVARCHGHEFKPEPRKDAASGEALPLSVVDWETAAIRAAFGEKADAIQKRIDAAPTPEARSYAIRERMADAREILDRRDHRGNAALESVERMRSTNAASDQNRQNNGEDRLAAATKKRRDAAEQQPIGAPQPTSPTSHGAA